MALLNPIRYNWATMPLASTEELGYDPLSGPEGLFAVFPNKDALPHDRLWLGCSVLIRIMGGVVTNFTKHRIRHYLANRLDINIATLIVEEVDEPDANYILVCPDGTTRTRALALGAITIEAVAPQLTPLDLLLTEWSPAYGGYSGPLSHRARIRLRKVPLHLWNFIDIHTLIAGFGFPLEIAPYFSNNNYNTLRLLIACGAPNTIPRHVWLSVEPICRIVDVEIEGWDVEPVNPPSPNDAESAVQGPRPPPPAPASGKPGPSRPTMPISSSEPSESDPDNRSAKRQRAGPPTRENVSREMRGPPTTHKIP